MKKSRLLEIIREEIAGALTENEALQDKAKKEKMEYIKAAQAALDAEKKETTTGGALEEDQNNILVPSNLIRSYITELIYSAEDMEYTPEMIKKLKDLKGGLSGGKISIEDALNVIQQTIDITEDEIDAIEALGQAVDYDNNIINAARNIKGLNEEPDFAGAGGRFDKQVAAKYGEEDTLEAATEKVTNRVLSDKGITKADVAKMNDKELKSLLKDIRAFISQKKQTPEVAAALKKQQEFDDSGSQLQDNQTNKAILRVLGFGSKKGPKGLTKPKAEKPAKEKSPEAEKTPKTRVATRTKGDDGSDDVSYSDVDSEDKEATQNIGSDSTAKELGKEADVSKNPDFDRIRKGLQNKRKNSKDGILSPEDMKLAINIINTAKDKYKFNTTQVDSLRADIGL